MIISTPTATNALLPMDYVRSLLGIREYTHVFHSGPMIGVNRNALFERARIEKESTLMIDSDMVFTRQDVLKIEEHLKKYDIVTGLCVMGFKEVGYPPSIFKKKGNGYVPCEPEEGLFEVDGCGGAFLGISQRVIETLTDPFTPIFEEKYGQFYGEDISFCIRAKEAGFKIICDPSISVGHIKQDIKYYGKTRNTLQA